MRQFEEIYQTYFEDVYKYLRALTANEHLSEELTSDTFYKALKAIDEFRGDCDVRVWLCQIAKNTYLSYLRKTKKEVHLDEYETVLIQKEDIEQLLINKELAFEIHQKLHKMKEPYKEVFSLRVFGELSFKQIAMLFGKSEHWACVTYHRAKEMIRGGMLDEDGL
jgi:RNA polymerase sigma-70 factor (ECF subfamily)